MEKETLMPCLPLCIVKVWPTVLWIPHAPLPLSTGCLDEVFNWLHLDFEQSLPIICVSL